MEEQYYPPPQDDVEALTRLAAFIGTLTSVVADSKTAAAVGELWETLEDLQRIRQEYGIFISIATKNDAGHMAQYTIDYTNGEIELRGICAATKDVPGGQTYFACFPEDYFDPERMHELDVSKRDIDGWIQGAQRCLGLPQVSVIGERRHTW